MTVPYISPRDSEALGWCQTFAAGLSSNPGAYMISVAEAAAIQLAVDAFASSYADAIDPAQRTPVVVSIKDESRNAAVQLCRQYATLIKYNAGISNPDKIAIGVRPVNPNRDPIECPQSSPVVNVVAATPGTHTVRFADSLEPEKRAKPFGATEIQIYVAIADEPVTDWNEARFYGKFTKNPVAVAFEPADNAKQATYFARWAGRRGDTGPWSNGVTMAIAA